MTSGWTWPIARIIEVHDADTLKLDIDLGFDVHVAKWIRLLNVHAPELKEPTGLKARQDAVDWVTANAPDGLVQVTTYRSPSPVEIRFKNSFTRYIGEIQAHGHVPSLNQHLRDLGYIDQGM